MFSNSLAVQFDPALGQFVTFTQANSFGDVGDQLDYPTLSDQGNAVSVSSIGEITGTPGDTFNYAVIDASAGYSRGTVQQATVPVVFSVDSITGGTIYVADTLRIDITNGDASGNVVTIDGVSVSVLSESANHVDIAAVDVHTFDGGIYEFGENIPVTVTSSNGSGVINYQTTPDVGFTQITLPDPIEGAWADPDFAASILPGVLEPGDIIWCTNPANSDATSGSFPEGSTIVYRIMEMSDPTPVWGSQGSFTVSGPDTAPVMPADVMVNVNEGLTAFGTYVATSGTTPITYSISGADASLLSINSSTGVVTANSAADFETKTSYSFIVTATNSAGNDSQNITVNINNIAEILPVISTGGSPTVTIPYQGSYSDPAWTWFDDVVTGQTPTWSGDTVDTNTPGTYTRTASATNSVGNTTQDYTITVEAAPSVDPTVVPTITVVGGTSTTITEGGSYGGDPAWTAADDVGSVAVVWTGDTVDTNTPGTYVRTATASNIVGNATPVDYTVTVQAAPQSPTTPTITLRGVNPVNIIRGQPFVDSYALAEDEVDGDLTADIVVTGDTVNTNLIGSYEIIYTVTNSFGNSASVSRVVNVFTPSAFQPFYQWYKDGQPIVGETSSTYTPVNDDVGSVLTVEKILTTTTTI